MRYHRLSALSILVTTPIPGLTTLMAPPWHDVRVKHAWNSVPDNWESLGPPPAGTTIDIHVALKPRNENALIDALYEVSTPGHPKYGAHLSREEAAKLVKPHSYTLDLVHSWLEHYGVPSSSISTTHGGGWLTLSNLPVSQANKLLSASYRLYRHVGTNDSAILRTVGYALPTVLHRHIQTVAPTTFFASMGTSRHKPRGRLVGAAKTLAKVGSRNPVTVMGNRDEPKVVTPELLRWLYNTVTYVPAATDKNALGVAGYANEFASPDDLTMFMIIFRSEAADATFTVKKVNSGWYDPSHPGEEGNLDMQYAQAMAYPTPHIYYSTGGQSEWTSNNEPAPNDAWLAWVKYVTAQKDVPKTLSTSYGREEKELPREYAKALCDLYALLGARGVSILFSSGDDGVGRGDCKAKDDPKKIQFDPSFPASCPWVTSVGGTMSKDPEVAASLSSGGFSNLFTRPDYQKDAVPAFFKHLGKKHEGLYNGTGRGIPDISAQAINFLTVIFGNAHIMNGTSCAVPTVAGIIALLNDYLLSNGKKTLGFLNPLLYGEGLSGINDIISGSNPGCGTDGFTAVAGWDPVTGLGTPDFSELQQVLFRKFIGPGEQGRAFSEPLNISDTPVAHSWNRQT